MKERVRVNLRETSNAKHANVTIEITGDVEDTDDMQQLEQLAKHRTRNLFEELSEYAETETMRDNIEDDPLQETT